MLWNFNKYIGVTLDVNCTWDVQDVSYFFGMGGGVILELYLYCNLKFNLLCGFSFPCILTLLVANIHN